jgi:exodeoxyribonuclease VII small subunit
MAKKELNFEASMERLAEIVRVLENGQEGLDASLELYREGVELVRLCSERLEKAEQTVRMLQVNADGSATLVPFEGEKENRT